MAPVYAELSFAHVACSHDSRPCCAFLANLQMHPAYVSTAIGLFSSFCITLQCLVVNSHTRARMHHSTPVCNTVPQWPNRATSACPSNQVSTNACHCPLLPAVAAALACCCFLGAAGGDGAAVEPTVSAVGAAAGLLAAACLPSTLLATGVPPC